MSGERINPLVAPMRSQTKTNHAQTSYSWEKAPSSILPGPRLIYRCANLYRWYMSSIKYSSKCNQLCWANRFVWFPRCASLRCGATYCLQWAAYTNAQPRLREKLISFSACAENTTNGSNTALRRSHILLLKHQDNP